MTNGDLIRKVFPELSDYDIIYAIRNGRLASKCPFTRFHACNGPCATCIKNTLEQEANIDG